MELAKELRQKRIQRGVSQVELSKKTGISRTYICDIEAGRYAPSIETVKKIAAALDMSLIFLDTNDGNTSQSKDAENEV